MNRYKLNSSESAQAADKLRSFEKAWYNVAQVHKIIDDAFPSDLRQEKGLALNVDTFRLHGSQSAFYEGHAADGHFYVKLSFEVTDMHHRDKKQHTITIDISTIMAITPESLQKNILQQASESQNNYDKKLRDADIIESLGDKKRPPVWLSQKEFDGWLK